MIEVHKTIINLAKSILGYIFLTSSCFAGSNMCVKDPYDFLNQRQCYPSNKCEAPQRPFEQYYFYNQYDLDSYNRKVTDYNEKLASYQSCIETYIKNAEDDIELIQSKIQKAKQESGFPFPSRDAVRATTLNEKMCDLYKSYKGKLPDEQLLSLCKKNSFDYECRKCILTP